MWSRAGCFLDTLTEGMGSWGPASWKVRGKKEIYGKVVKSSRTWNLSDPQIKPLQWLHFCSISVSNENRKM